MQSVEVHVCRRHAKGSQVCGSQGGSVQVTIIGCYFEFVYQYGCLMTAYNSLWVLSIRGFWATLSSIRDKVQSLEVGPSVFNGLTLR